MPTYVVEKDETLFCQRICRSRNFLVLKETNSLMDQWSKQDRGNACFDYKAIKIKIKEKKKNPKCVECKNLDLEHKEKLDCKFKSDSTSLNLLLKKNKQLNMCVLNGSEQKSSE